MTSPSFNDGLSVNLEKENVAEKSCLIMSITEKECNFSFYLLYYLCFYVLPIQSYADQKKL